MPDIDEYPLGTVVTVYGEWDVGAVPTDPNLVTLYVQAPDGGEVTYTSMLPHSLPEPPIVRTAVGRFEADLSPAMGGLWRYRWEGIGLADGARDGAFYIGHSFVGTDLYTYDPKTDIGAVRLYIDDRDLRNTTALNPRRRTAIFNDEEIGVFLTTAGSPLNAAALALISIANNRALLVQRRQIGKTDVDYGTLRADLLKTAAALKEQAVAIGEDYMAPADGIVEHAWNDFGMRSIVYNTAVRDE